LASRTAELAQRLAGRLETHAAGATIEAEGEPASSRVLVAGWAARVKMLSGGGRQILRLLVPGDFCSYAGAGRPSLSATVALTRTKSVDLGAVTGAALRDPQTEALIATFAPAPEVEHEALLLHAVRLGRLSARERTLHLLLELWERLTRAGLADGRTMLLPLTQEVLADTLGLSVVHMNRTLQQLRREELIEAQAGRSPWRARSVWPPFATTRWTPRSTPALRGAAETGVRPRPGPERILRRRGPGRRKPTLRIG